MKTLPACKCEAFDYIARHALLDQEQEPQLVTSIIDGLKQI
jgi:hypothetical protein